MRLPIHRGRASAAAIIAYALVDDADARWASKYHWTLNSFGYAIRTTPRPEALRILLHREILGLPAADESVSDHINRDKLDCRRENLRIVTRAQNNQNRDSYRNGKSSYRGVSWDAARGLWRATAQANGQWKQIGRFPSEREAAEAAAAWRRENMPYSFEPAIA